MTDGVRLRRLSEEEIELWLSVAASVERRAGASMPERLAKQLPMPIPQEPAVSTTPAPAPPPGATSGKLPLAPLERKLKQKLSRGRMTADAVIDLHGLRQAEAHTALHRFLRNAQRDGARVVLVVTGKGMRSYGAAGVGADEWREVGVLKRSVPLWLGLPDFRSLVIGFEEAGRPHGGAGALYVRLRRAGGRGG